MSNDDLLLVGHVRKAHGLKGEVVLHLSTNREERVAPGAVIRVGEVDMTVKASRPKDQDFLVTFEGVFTREAADELRGSELRAEPLDDPDELWVHELVGAQVVDQSGVERGEVTSVLVNPASDLLELDTDALVPVTFVTGLDPEAGIISVEVPDGLFDL